MREPQPVYLLTTVTCIIEQGCRAFVASKEIIELEVARSYAEVLDFCVRYVLDQSSDPRVQVATCNISAVNSVPSVDMDFTLQVPHSMFLDSSWIADTLINKFPNSEPEEPEYLFSPWNEVTLLGLSAGEMDVISNSGSRPGRATIMTAQGKVEVVERIGYVRCWLSDLDS